MFIFSGATKLMDPSVPAEMIASKGLPAPELLAYAAGILEVAAGLAIAVGWMTRPSAIALAAFTLIAGLLFHDFWNYTGQEGQMQMQAFMKNIAIIGGFLVLYAHGPGRYAIGGHRRETDTTITATPNKLGMA